jgi:hypothetical protein
MFLTNTAASEAELLQRIADRAARIQYFKEADDFGATVFDLIESVGRKSLFHRMLVV